MSLGSRAASRLVAGGNYRLTSSAEDLKEYDAFGPWILPIRSEADMPKRFRPFYPEHRDAVFLYKIPRDIDRVQALPGWDLYTTVLAVHDDRLSVMRLSDGKATAHESDWNAVVATVTHTNLLLGGWKLLLADGSSVEIEHNSVSSDMMAKITAFARDKWRRSGRRPEAADVPTSVDVSEEYFFRNKLHGLRHTTAPSAVPIHYEPKNRWCRDERGRIALTTGLMIVDTPDEFVIFNRGRATRPWHLHTYASNIIEIPHNRLSSFSITPRVSGNKVRFHELRLRADERVITQICFVAPDRTAETLEARGLRRE